MIGLLKPAAHIEPLADSKVDSTYRRLRWQVFFGIFIGYAAYYFVRKNFGLAMPGMIESGMYSKKELGFALSSLSIAYGLSKFLMASVSDRSNARIFLPLGLALSGITMLCMGTMPWATSSVWIMFALLFLNGWFQGMGWPPCGRTMVHWWSKKERGTIVSVWNTAHNFGGAVPALLVVLAGSIWASSHGGQEATSKDLWQQALYYPGFAAIAVALLLLVIMRDTPQSCGLPPIEKWRDDYPDDYDEATYEHELPAKEIFMTYVFRNKLLWYIAFANVFVYLIRYGILDWSPTYLKEVKDFTIDKSSWAYAFYELAAIPGTLLCGWMSDKVFKGKRGLTGLFFMALVTIAVTVYWLNPKGNPNVDMWMLTVIGFLIYGPVMLIGLHALELAPKKAAGTAAGFTGLFGYLGGSVAASAVIGATVDSYGWDGGFYVMIGGSLLACFLLFLTTIQEAKHKAKIAENDETY